MDNTLQSKNVISGLIDLFYRPSYLFNALAVKNNWSWIPFFLLVFFGFISQYNYFNVVDFTWYVEQLADAILGPTSPAEKANFMSRFSLNSTQWSQALATSLILPVIFALILAAIFNFLTQNDDKSIQDFTDWFGAMWWMSLPAVINHILAYFLIISSDYGTQLSDTIFSPISLAYITGSSLNNDWHDILLLCNLGTFWSIFLSFKCLKSWTAFSNAKAAIVAVIPISLLNGLILLITYLLT